MKHAGLGLLCLFFLLPTVALAQHTSSSLGSITPSSFYSFELEQTATLHGVDLFGDFYGGPPDQTNIFLSTHLLINGPAGQFTEDISGGFRVSGTLNDTIYMSIPDSTLLVEGHYSVTVIATDDVGPRSIGPVFYDVIPRPVAPQPPSLSTPEIVTAEAAGPSGANVAFEVVVISYVDPSPVANCNHASGSLFPLGGTTVTCTYSDSLGSASASFLVNVTDTVAPVLHLPGHIATNNPVVSYTATATDNVDNTVNVSCTPASGTTFPIGTTIVTCRAVDAHANVAGGSFKVTVSGVGSAPTITVPDNITAEATTAAGAAVTYSVTASDGATISCSPASGATFPLGPTTVSCSATTAGGTSTDSFVITVVDTTKPALSLPGTINVSASSPAGAVVTYVATASDLVAGNVPVYCDPMSGSTFPIGTSVVQCNAGDNNFNVGLGAFLVIVSSDSVPPVLSLPANITVEATGASGAAVTFTATANDNVDGPVPVSCSHASGSTFPLGTTTVQCDATDAHNNTATGSFLVTISDTTAPSLSLPANITAEATSASGAAVTYAATASDLVDGARPVSCDHASGSTFALGTTTVQCTASDTRNNAATGSFTVTVRDTTPPVLTLPGGITKEATSASGATATFTATSTDLVDGARPVSCTPASGSTFPLGTTTVQCTASDTHNNTATGSFTVTVRDTTPPSLTVPANITAEATGPGGAAVTYTATATDLVDGSRPVTCDHPSGSTFSIGTTTVQCSATDTHNNTAYKSFTVLVQDTTPPTIVSITASPSNLWPPNHKAVAVTISVIASDLVDPHPTSHILSVSSNQPINGIGDGNTSTDWTITGPLTLNLLSERTGGTDRVYTITIETTDASGNSAHGTVTVTVGNPRGRAVH